MIGMILYYIVVMNASFKTHVKPAIYFIVHIQEQNDKLSNIMPVLERFNIPHQIDSFTKYVTYKKYQ